jgi:hypothetical protein
MVLKLQIERIWVDGEEVNFYGASPVTYVSSERQQYVLAQGLVDELNKERYRISGPKSLSYSGLGCLKLFTPTMRTPDALEYATEE